MLYCTIVICYFLLFPRSLFQSVLAYFYGGDYASYNFGPRFLCYLCIILGCAAFCGSDVFFSFWRLGPLECVGVRTLIDLISLSDISAQNLDAV